MHTTITSERSAVPAAALLATTRPASRPTWPTRRESVPGPAGLTSQEEVALIRRAQGGDDRARERLVAANTRLVYSIARRYHCRSLTLDDLAQEGTIGLLVAIERFNPTLGCRLSTYASHWIRQAIARSIEHKDRLIRIPVQASQELRQVEQAREALRQRLQREPGLDEIAGECLLPAERVHQLLGAGDPVSLEALIGPDQDVQLGEIAADENAANPEQDLLEDAGLAAVRGMLDRLDERERFVIMQRYGLNGQPPKTLQELSDTMRISREGVRRVEVRALARLRHSMKAGQWEE